MTGVRFPLACVWTLVITQTVLVLGDVQFLERYEGESVLLPCAFEQSGSQAFGVYLKRRWLQPSDVLFMLEGYNATVDKDEDQTRISVGGDPSSHSVSVTISELRVSDTDRYYSAAPASLDIGLIETCAGGSAVLPCLPPNGEDLAVEGISLKRQRGRASVEMLYHSKRQPGSSPSSSSSSQFPTGRVQLSSAPGPGGLAYSLTLQRMQPDESALYSCQLLVRGRADTTSSLGRQVFFVSVQDAHCGCSGYSTLLYALSSAVAVLLLLLVGFVVVYRGKAHHSVKQRPQAPIYEEMTGVKPLGRKVAPRHLEEIESSEYRNCSVKKSCHENHYESPTPTSCSLR